ANTVAQQAGGEKGVAAGNDDGDGDCGGTEMEVGETVESATEAVTAEVVAAVRACGCEGGGKEEMSVKRKGRVWEGQERICRLVVFAVASSNFAIHRTKSDKCCSVMIFAALSLVFAASIMIEPASGSRFSRCQEEGISSSTFIGQGYPHPRGGYHQMRYSGGAGARSMRLR
ncbi:Protein of unknown function, partial [Gryllus bimaculatus]